MENLLLETPAPLNLLMVADGTLGTQYTLKLGMSTEVECFPCSECQVMLALCLGGPSVGLLPLWWLCIGNLRDVRLSVFSGVAMEESELPDF